MLCASSPLLLEQLIKTMGAEASMLACKPTAVTTPDAFAASSMLAASCVLPMANPSTEPMHASLPHSHPGCFAAVATMTGGGGGRGAALKKLDARAATAATPRMTERGLQSATGCELPVEQLPNQKDQIALQANEVFVLHQPDASAEKPLATQEEVAARQEAQEAELRRTREQLMRKDEELASIRSELERLLRAHESLRSDIETYRERAEASEAMWRRESDRREEIKRRVLTMLHAQLSHYQKGHFMKIDPSTLSVDSVLCNGYAARNIIDFYRMLLDVSVSERDVFVHLSGAFPAQVQLTDRTIRVAPL